MEKRTSIKRRFLVFSIVLFLAIFGIGSFAFIVSMQSIVHSGKGNELRQVAEIKRLELESSVNSEIAIVLKMTNSPLIQRYFANPTDPDLEKIALEEIGGYRRALAGSLFWVNDTDKKFYSDSTYAYTVDIKDPNNYWYLMTLNETEKYNFNINYNPDLKSTNLWVNAPVFDSKRKPVGILGTGIDLTAFINSIYKNYTGGASFYLFNSAGEITGAKDANLVAQKMQVSKLLGETGEKVFDIAKNLSPGKIENFTAADGEFAVGSVPALGWHIVLIHPISMQDYLKTNMSIIYISTIVIIAFIFIIFNISIGWIISPLKKLIETLKSISLNWDLTQRVAEQSRNEIGELACYFNKLMETMQTPIAETKAVTGSLATASEELSTISNELTVASEGTVSRAASATDRTGRMAENVNTMANGAEQASANANEVASAADLMSSNMNTVASAIEEMSASINQIAGNTSEVRKISKEATEKSGNATDVMSKLGVAAKEIGQVTNVIKNIADKTNLLALNATIEAASAGEAGKGFAVVAGEIKELANQSAASADDITNRIEDIQKGTNNAVEVIGSVSNIIQQINQSVENIAGHIDQQMKASNEIANNVSQANTGSKRVAGSIGEVAKGVDDVSKNAGDAARRVGQLAEEVTLMSSEASKSNQCASKLKTSAGNLINMADNLRSVMEKFKV